MLLDPHASQAYERPWCALTEIGGGAMYENCNIPTFELCVQEVIAGNRGFCIPNPRWQPPSRAASEGVWTTEGRFRARQLTRGKGDISQGGAGLPIAPKRPALGRLLLL
jgi:hypothetical protein